MASAISVTLVNDTLYNNMNWWVSEEYTHSEHQAIPPFGAWMRGKYTKKTAVGARNKRNSISECPSTIGGNDADGNGEEKEIQVVEKIQKTCGAPMPTHIVFNKRLANFWWNSKIEECRLP